MIWARPSERSKPDASGSAVEPVARQRRQGECVKVHALFEPYAPPVKMAPCCPKARSEFVLDVHEVMPDVDLCITTQSANAEQSRRERKAYQVTLCVAPLTQDVPACG